MQPKSLYVPSYGAGTSHLWLLQSGGQSFIVDAPGNPSTSLTSMTDFVFRAHGGPFFFYLDGVVWYYDNTDHGRPGFDVDRAFSEKALAWIESTNWEMLTQFN
jgi:hypothetical protein